MVAKNVRGAKMIVVLTEMVVEILIFSTICP
jgi:hypothetical protein